MNQKLIKWFSKLTAEQRLNIALQIEDFRRNAKFMKEGKDGKNRENI